MPIFGTGEGMGEEEGVPLMDVATGTMGVNVGNTVAVKIPGTGVVVMVGVTALGVPIVSVEVGFGLGGFCQTKTNPPIRMQRPNTPQPRPLNKNLSNVAISLLGDFIVSTDSKA